MSDSNTLINKKIAFLGNQDNVSIMLSSCLLDNGISTDVYALQSELGNARSALKHTNSAENRDISIINDSDSVVLKLPNELKKQLEKYDIVVVLGLNAPYLAAQIDVKRLIYMPIGGAELVKFINDRSVVDSLVTGIKKWKEGSGSLITAIRTSLAAPKRLDNFATKIAGVTSRHISGNRMAEYSNFADKAFPSAQPLAWPEFLPQLKFIRSQLSGSEMERITATYSQYDRVIIAPSRKWIIPDIRTGYAKATQYILKALDHVFNNLELDQKINKVIWLDHGPDAEYCKNYINNSQWKDAVDFLPHQNAKSLWSMFSLKNALMLDEFNDAHWGNLGGAAREALFLGCPVFGRNFQPTQTPFREAYDNVPFIYCSTQDDLNSKLAELMTNNDSFKLKRKEIVEWVDRFKADDRLFNAIQDVLNVKEPKLIANSDMLAS